MKKTYIFLVFGLFLYFTSTITKTESMQEIQDISCPPAENIFPCICPNTSSIVQLYCYDWVNRTITQEVINVAFQELRLQNPGKGLAIQTFSLSKTNMTTFDLTPLIDITFGTIDLSENTQLVTITGPEPIELFTGRISTSAFYLFKHPSLNTEGFGNTLKYFEPSKLNELSLFKSGFDYANFTGLSAFNNLTRLVLSRNSIQSIGHREFSGLSNLTSLILWGNPIQEIADGAFEFDVIPKQRIKIEVDACNMTEDVISADHGLEKLINGVDLNFDYNNLSTISANKFEKMLRSSENHKITYRNNPIVCDERVKWLKDEREFFEPKVWNTSCVNDPGKTVFTSTLIP
jgi:Leucine-rich repeat (LRR) protein